MQCEVPCNRLFPGVEACIDHCQQAVSYHESIVAFILSYATKKLMQINLYVKLVQNFKLLYKGRKFGLREPCSLSFLSVVVAVLSGGNLVQSLGGTNFFCCPPNWEILGGRRGTHCILEL